MGLEARCTASVGRKKSDGKALLETESLIFRGEFSLQIAFGAMREVSVDGDALVIQSADQEARFELGAAAAARWARRIKEPRTLVEKLEIGQDVRVAVVGVRDGPFLTALRQRGARVVEGRVPEGVPVVFFGAETRESLRRVQLLRARMMDAGVLWIVRPKGSKDIAEKDVFEAGRGAGLVDTKVVAFSSTHTAHKWVIPVEQRGTPRRRAPIQTIPPSSPALAATKAVKAAAQGTAKKR
jgi:hypothetical protein